jgi:hypothetical protein
MRRPRASVLCVALLCATGLGAGTAQARKPRAPKPASAPSTEQILAPSAATVPDALPTDKSIYRCGSTYSSRPCADARPLAVADARSDAQRRQAEDVSARDKRMAAWLEAGRHEREAASAPRPGRVAKPVKKCVTRAGKPCKVDDAAAPQTRQAYLPAPPKVAAGKPK